MSWRSVNRKRSSSLVGGRNSSRSRPRSLSGYGSRSRSISGRRNGRSSSLSRSRSSSIGGRRAGSVRRSSSRTRSRSRSRSASRRSGSISRNNSRSRSRNRSRSMNRGKSRSRSRARSRSRSRARSRSRSRSILGIRIGSKSRSRSRARGGKRRVRRKKNIGGWSFCGLCRIRKSKYKFCFALLLWIIMLVCDVAQFGIPIYLLLRTSNWLDYLWNTPNFIVPFISLFALAIGIFKPIIGTIAHVIVVLANGGLCAYTFLFLYDYFAVRNASPNIFAENESFLFETLSIPIPRWIFFEIICGVAFIASVVCLIECFLRSYRNCFRCCKSFE